MGYPRENTIPFKAVGAAGGAVTATSPNPGTDHRWRLRSVLVSLSAAPAAAVTVTIDDGGTLAYTVDIPATGPLIVNLTNLDWQGAAGHALTVAVAAPGGTVVARVNASAVLE